MHSSSSPANYNNVDTNSCMHVCLVLFLVLPTETIPVHGQGNERQRKRETKRRRKRGKIIHILCSLISNESIQQQSNQFMVKEIRNSILNLVHRISIIFHGRRTIWCWYWQFIIRPARNSSSNISHMLCTMLPT